MEDFIAAGGTGVRFNPTDEELVTLYLFSKHAGLPLPHKECVLESDLYGCKEPWEVFEECSATTSNNSSSSDVDDRVKYFFTTLKRKSKKCNLGTRFERTVAGKNGGGGGKWHGNGNRRPILHDKKVVGYVTTFIYKKKNDGGGGGSGDSWLMKEYTLDERVLKALRKAKKRDKTVSRHCVLCRIKRKKNKKEDRGRHVVKETAVESNLAAHHDPAAAVATMDDTSTSPPLPPQISDHHYGFNNSTNAGAQLIVSPQPDDRVACDENHVISDTIMTDTTQDDETNLQVSEFTTMNELCPPPQKMISSGHVTDITSPRGLNERTSTGAEEHSLELPLMIQCNEDGAAGGSVFTHEDTNNAEADDDWATIMKLINKDSSNEDGLLENPYYAFPDTMEDDVDIFAAAYGGGAETTTDHDITTNECYHHHHHGAETTTDCNIIMKESYHHHHDGAATSLSPPSDHDRTDKVAGAPPCNSSSPTNQQLQQQSVPTSSSHLMELADTWNQLMELADELPEPEDDDDDMDQVQEIMRSWLADLPEPEESSKCPLGLLGRFIHQEQFIRSSMSADV